MNTAAIVAAVCAVMMWRAVPQTRMVDAPRAVPTSTTAADCLPEYDPSAPCRFQALGAEYQVEAFGMCRRVGPTGDREEIRLPLERNARIERVLYAELQHDLLLVYEVSDGESGWGMVVRLAHGPPLALKWRQRLPGFNISPGAIDRGRLYQAGMGFVAAIGLDRGQFVWRHSALYDPKTRSFNAFRQPHVKGAEVIFEEEPVDDRRAPRRIRVAVGTGRILDR